MDRTRGRRGVCRAGVAAKVSSAGPHFGEEPPLVGARGSGTVFFAWCNLACVYCQNHELSHLGHGVELSTEELAELFVGIERSGCENLNLVSPTHYAPQILAALDLAARDGLGLPVVWNTGGYEALHTLSLLDGVVDIYMPDLKYAEPPVAQRLSGARDYPAKAFAAAKEMHRQVGDLEFDTRGVAARGLLVRHLVLPGGLAGTSEVVRFLAEEVSADTYINIMAQYRPCYRAHEFPELARCPTS
ncbi:MAG TPA: radical SAM protein, partial [Coriobacteriia bacterium]|nr:radical SAM protein [Coriobacteriia bacterium]